MISAVNFSEVIQKAVQRGGELATVTLHLERLMLDVVPFDALQAERAAAVWPAARPLGLSFADRACLALGILRATTVLTADRQMAETGLPVKVKLIRRHA
jgi:PIN domain nuclease of toxin-antitoxin system